MVRDVVTKQAMAHGRGRGHLAVRRSIILEQGGTIARVRACVQVAQRPWGA